MKKIRNFDIQHKLGSGSYGVIYKVLNKATREVCVLKQISLGRLGEKAKKSAINEATIMGKLVHPFIVRYRESFIEDNILNIVMEYCDNGDLNNFLKMQNKRPLKEDKIWRFFIEITTGLQYIHKNKILHRDIKSLNIFMNKNEEIKIGDLGVAKMLTSNEFAQTMVGTPFYLSPELCEEKPYNEKSDIWALGCLLYELCTFRHPFEAHNQASLILKIVRGKYSPIPEFYSKDLKEVIDVCLERDYKRRPTTSNLLARPKIREKIEQFGINRLVEDELKKITKEKQNIGSTAPKVKKQDKPVVPLEKNVKAVDADSRKAIKAVDSEPKKQIKKEVVKKQEPVVVKKEEVLKKHEVKREPVIILPKPINHSEKKLEVIDGRKQNEVRVVKENKNDFISNLNKMMDEDEKHKKVIKSGNIFSQAPIKPADMRKQEKIQRVAEKVDELKGKPLIKSPSLNEPKRQTPALPSKKSANEGSNIKKQEVIKAPMVPSKPPMPPNSQNVNKQVVTKVKNEKVIQPKVYDSQKNLNKPSGIIKSGGFSSHIESDKPQKEKNQFNSRDKLFSAKRASNPVMKIQKEKQKETPKQLFGPSATPTPQAQHKSEKNIKGSGYAAIYEQKKKEENNKVSRVRKGVKNEMARNARNVSRYNEISKEEEDLVMNLPSNLKSGMESSDSDEDIIQNSERNVVEELKRKSNQNKFHLKEINNDLVLQKYEDMLDSTEKGDEENEFSNGEEDSLEQVQQQQIHRVEVKKQQNKVLDAGDDWGEENNEEEEENIIEQIPPARRNSRNSNDPIQQILESDVVDDRIEDEDQEEEQQEERGYLEEGGRGQLEGERQEWSFDEEPQLPMMEEKESPYFEPNNPYLVEEQEETVENKINHLQTKLQENMKREDELNKLMQMRLEECRKFVGTEKSLQEILEFFRAKLHMDDDYNESDEKEVEVFLKRKGLTDHNKFQNIYKIMHFEMELENTRKIIQRICKRLSEFEEDS